MKHICLLLLLLFGNMGAYADNTVTLSSVSGTSGTEVTISVAMTNTDAVANLQLSIPLDEGLSFVDGSVAKTDRLKNHSVSAGVKDDVLNLLIYSTSMTAIDGNKGDICSFKLLLGNTPGSVSLSSSKTTLTSTEGKSLVASVSDGTVDIRGAKAKIVQSLLDFGRVALKEQSRRSVMITNVGNESLTITNLAFSSTIFSSTEDLPLTINAGSSYWINVSCIPTVLGYIDEELVITSNSVSGQNTIRLTATPYAVNELSLGNASGSTGEEVTITVSLKNMNEISGLQMEIEIPDELEYVDGSFEFSDRKEDHVATTSVVDGILSIVIYSPNDKIFKGSEGEVGSFKVKILGSNNAYLNVNKAMLSSTINGRTADVSSGTSGCTVSIRSPYLYARSSLDFGNVSINQQNVQSSLAIRNWGDASLIISNIVFPNGLFSVKEQMPITIDPSSYKDITVVCNAREAGDLSTNMEIYSNDPNQRLYIVNVSGKIFTPDYISGSVEAKRDEVNLDISLNNYSNIYGIQFDINPSGMFSVSDQEVLLAERGKDLSVSIKSVSEGKLRIVAYCQNEKFISNGEGKMMTIKLKPSESLQDGEYNMTLSNIMLGSQGMKNVYAGNDLTVTFGVGDPVVVTANSYTRIYGEANPLFEYSTSGADLVGIPEISCEAIKTSPVGTYPIVITKGSVSNYNDSYVNGTLTITKAPLTIKAGTYTRKQGEDNPEFTLTYDGFKNDETEDVLTTQVTVSTTATKESEVGEYEVKVSGAEAENYEISYTNGVLTVTEADPIVLTANSYTRVYGDDNPSFEYTTFGADLVGIPEITCEATKTSPVGTYPIVINKGSVSNYNDSYVNGTLTITKAPLTIKAGTYTRKQGEENPEFTLTYEGFKNDETKDVLTTQATVSTTATKESAVGEYEVKVSGAEAENYEISYTNGVLAVTEADLIVLTANSYTRVYGDDNPTFEYATSGADLIGIPEITCEATKTSPVGTYPIVINKGSVSNYNDSYVNGILTITKAPLTIKAGTYTKNQGEDNPEFILTYEGFKNGETNVVLTKQATATCNATKESAMGDYIVSVSGAEAQNYDISYVNGKLIIEMCLGDANGDRLVNAADIVAVICHKNGNTPAGFVESAADVNKDQKIDELDVKAIVNIIMKREN